MAAAPRASTLLSLLESRGERLIVLGELDNDSGYTPLFTSTAVPEDPDSLPADLRADVALVALAAGKPLPIALLARLRDVHVAQVVLAAGKELSQGGMARRHRDYFAALRPLPAARQAAFDEESRESIERQRRIESEDAISLDDYLDRYFNGRGD